MKKFIYKFRFLTVIYEVCRLIGAKISILLGKKEICPVWYSFKDTPAKTKKENLEINKKWFSISRSLYIHEHIYYNLDNALAVNPKIKGLALVFFMGLGDYLYTTPLIEALAKRYPKLELWAYVSDKMDRNNSPLVAGLLKTNPHIKIVQTFTGIRNPFIWKNYDYSEVVKKAPEDFLVLPVYYEYKPTTLHRTASLFETFNLPFRGRKNFPKPIFYFPEEISTKVKTVLESIKKSAKKTKGIIFLQLDSRASFYTYPEIDTLVRKLIWENYFVITVTKCGVMDPHFKILDIKQFSFNENCFLLSLLKKEFPLYIVALNSVFWAASAGLDIPNLGLQHWQDPKVHNLHYPNILMLTEIKYAKIPSKNQIVVREGIDFTRHNEKIIDFKVETILKYLNTLINIK